MSMVKLGRETECGVNVYVKFPGRAYIDQFINLNCAPDLLAAKLFPNAKEITESMAALAAVRKAVGVQRFGDPSIKLIDVGCGHTPRTAALMACVTRWNCDAVDPEVNSMKAWGIERLMCHKARIEECDFEYGDSHVVIVCVHSHAKLRPTLNHIHFRTATVIAMPCCVPLEITDSHGRIIPPDDIHEDPNIWSPERIVKTWNLMDWS